MSLHRRLLLDVDGVLGDFHEAARDLINDLFGIRLEMSAFTTWDVTDVLPTAEMKAACNNGIAEPGFASSLKPFPEAQKAVEKLRSIPDVEILFVTTPHHISKTWMQERNEWLSHHFNARQDEIIHCFRKYAVAGHGLVDDKPDNVEKWGLHHPNGHALLWDTPYNRRESHLRRVVGWDEIVDLFGFHR